MGTTCLNDGLVLGLSLESSSANNTNQKPKLVKPCLNFEPSLSLGLSGEIYAAKKIISDVQTSSPHSHSGVSSFSSGRVVKRERDVSSEDINDVERFSSRVSDEDEDGSNTRKKLRLTKDQSALLEESFKQHSTLNPKQKQALARQLNLRPRQVEVWFQNRRARTKLKQTEVDCEFLKKCCETLTDENRRLQKEVQELKALKMSQPFYMQMQMPAATLTMCPSCERIGGSAAAAAASVNDASSKNNINPFSKSHHFYNPFTNPSAAC
ncbi:homeobox-leucine zipper protein HAT9-like [Euphorbia lathyris]|uniref:homeobox-leucine zipper protein HAT9-like n=1 Tax=Euphorbia lathyris TaxID=212925 RepID=UPI003313D50B